MLWRTVSFFRTLSKEKDRALTKVRPGLLSWASDIEAATLEQAAKTARLPFVVGHVALMPDAHVGFGSTFGPSSRPPALSSHPPSASTSAAG